MKSKEILFWYEIYEEMANCLLAFYQEHKRKSSTVLYNLLNEVPGIEILYQIGNTPSIEQTKSDSKNSFPIQPSIVEEEMNVFQLYSALGKLKEEQRSDTIRLLFNEIFNKSSSHINNIDYRGYIKVNYQWISENHDKSWELFEFFTLYRGQSFNSSAIPKGVKIALEEYTKFMYLVNSKYFLPLTDEIKKYLTESLKITINLRSWKNYFKLINNQKTNLFTELVVKTSRQHESSDINERLINEFIHPEMDFITEAVPSHGQSNKKSTNESEGFRLIGIKVLPVKNEKRKIHEKSLVVNKYYGFYDCYIPDNKNFKYIPEKDVFIYNQPELKINVSAIVGKNGSGKSTIFELIYMAIFNISYKEGLIDKYIGQEEKKALKPINDLNLELYIETDKLYKITVETKNDKTKIEVIPYGCNNQENIYKPQTKIQWSQSFLEEICYTVTINYSIHGLNSIHHGPWLKHLFHKNDSYQVPMVIEPFRVKGNIDVNKQEQLARYRLLANVLKIQTDIKQKIINKKEIEAKDYRNRILVDDKIASKILLNLKDELDEPLWIGEDEIPLSEINNIDIIKSEISDLFEVDFSTIENTNIKEAIETYLLKKLFKIAYRYKQYRDRFFIKEADREIGIVDLRLLIQVIINDNSHISYKLKQAVNFVRFQKELFNCYNSDRTVTTKFSLNVDSYSKVIDKLSNQYKIPLINLLPPAIFDFDIELETLSQEKTNVAFSTLSSGEKQLIYAANSISYHISNISSVHGSSSTILKYKNVNILLDEIELYFHPEMQRKYLTYLLDFIEKSDIENIGGINICFVTHSPFILSDIPESNILFLIKEEGKDKTKILENKPKTFGANIHDLLLEGFFMDDSIGQFALKKINEIIKEHQSLDNNNQKINISDDEKTRRLKEFNFIVDNIGEEYLQGILRDQVKQIERKYWPKQILIDQLEKQLSQLKNEKEIK